MNARESEIEGGGPMRWMRASRRGALAVAAGFVGPWLARTPDAEARRRNACQMRCGGDRRMCRVDCRDWGSAEKACKRACNKLRDACFDLCEFTPVRSRLARW